MNRCAPVPTSPVLRHRPVALLVAVLLTWSGLANAQAPIRNFPKAALRGSLVVVNPPEVRLDGATDRLSPGSRIHAANNMLILSGALVGQELVVNYVREAQGMLHEVWILTPAEAAIDRPHAATR